MFNDAIILMIFKRVKKEKRIGMTHPCVYCDGVFDLGPHAGHVGYFREVRRLAEEELGSPVKLIVGVISDASTMSYKRKPIVNEIHRATTTAACRYVDEVVPNSPLILTEEFLNHHKIQLVFHGNDSNQSEFFRVPVQMGIMRYCQYDPDGTGVTTTDLIQRCKDR